MVTSTIDFNTRVGQFVQLRDKIKALKEKHDEELEPYKNMMEQLSGLLLNHLNQVGADNVNTSSGTVYKSQKDSASIADMSAFWGWVLKHNELDMVDRKANVTAVRSYILAQEQLAKADPTIVPMPPPGVNFSSVFTVGVRRAGKK
jgi:hypothetical protein